jgi:hypothetical protein
MGRPLNKKYFGNRNVGSSSVTTDNGIGGEGVASVDNPVAGSININNSYPSFPALTGTAPTLPGGVTATYTVTWEVDTVVLSGGTGYTAGAITSITGLDTYASTPTRFSVTQSGGVPTFGAFTNRGEYTTIDGTGITTWAVVKGAANDAQATIKFRVKSIAVSEKGSGYVTVPSLSWGSLSGTTPSGNTPTLTTDSGSAGSSTNQENAIITYAYVTGGSLKLGDIVKQSNDRRYKVKTADGTEVCMLKSTIASAAKEMNIVATDSAGGTYYVTKLTSRKAVLVPAAVTRLSSSAGSQFASGTSAKWTFGSAVLNDTVTIENA